MRVFDTAQQTYFSNGIASVNEAIPGVSGLLVLSGLQPGFLVMTPRF